MSIAMAVLPKVICLTMHFNQSLAHGITKQLYEWQALDEPENKKNVQTCWLKAKRSAECPALYQVLWHWEWQSDLLQLWKENLVKVELANFYCNCFSGLGKCNIMVLTETSLNSHWKSLLEQVRKQTYLWQWILLQDHCWWCRVPHTGAISLWSKMGQPQIQGT